MAFNRQQVYITCTGELGTGGGAGEDIFSFGLRFSGSVTFDAVASLAAVDTAAVAGLYEDFIQDAETQLSDRVHAFSVKFSPLGTDGALLTDPVIETLGGGGGVNGAASSPDFPNQVSLAISLRTVTNVGLAHKGRFYLPIPAITVLTNGHISSDAPPLVAGTVKTLIDGINSEFGDDTVTGGAVAIMSSVGAGMTRGVTRVGVGDVLDTMRTRRNALTETYSFEDIA